MKRHGLWQFHHALRASRQSDLRWWDDEIQEAGRAVGFVTRHYLGGAFVPEVYRAKMQIIRCVNRVMRRWKLPMNVETWNALCATVADRCRAHYMALRAASIEGCRGVTKIRPYGQFVVPHPARYVRDVQLRLERRKEHIKEKNRLARENAIRDDASCFRCKREATRLWWLFNRHSDLLGLSEAFAHRKSGYLPICATCYMTLGKWAEKALRADIDRISINKVRKKIRESTQNHAGTP